MCPLGLRGTQPQPCFYLRCWLTSATIRKWQLPIALQGGALETHHDGHPTSCVGRKQPFFKAGCNTSVGLYLQSRLHHTLPFLGTHTLYATRQTLTATNRPIVRTPNLNATSLGRPFLWEVVDCHFTLPLCSSRVGFSPPCFCLGDGESLCQKGDSPM